MQSKFILRIYYEIYENVFVYNLHNKLNDIKKPLTIKLMVLDYLIKNPPN
jgi:hypothetical protein